jgi:hypothetical protein
LSEEAAERKALANSGKPCDPAVQARFANVADECKALAASIAAYWRQQMTSLGLPADVRFHFDRLIVERIAFCVPNGWRLVEGFFSERGVTE